MAGWPFRILIVVDGRQRILTGAVAAIYKGDLSRGVVSRAVENAVGR